MTASDGSMQAALKVQELQRKLYRAAKAQPKRTFGILYDKVCSDMVVRTAFELVRRNRGAAGVDGITIESIEASGVERFLQEIREELQQEEYRPMPVRRVYIPKGDGKQRPLGIPRVKDRVVQAAVKLVIEPLFEASFRPNSFGFRPKRSAHDAIQAIRREVYGRKEDVIDLDLKSYFDTIDQKILMELVRRRVRDPRVLRLINLWLRAGVMEDGSWKESDLGTPQGGVISPLLANIYLHPLDLWWETKMQGARLVRYADDMVVLCPKGSAERYMIELRKFLSRLKLLVNEEKTRLVTVRTGFDFLGASFRKQRTERWPHKQVCYVWPSRRSMQRLRDKVRALVDGDLQSSLSEKIHQLNPVIRGWGNYFRPLNSNRAFKKVDDYVWRKLTRWLRLKHHSRTRVIKSSPTALYQRVGLATLCGTVRYAS
jgi:group II intron reverse transcriptase/maturase